jgi:hypothetical protein
MNAALQISGWAQPRLQREKIIALVEYMNSGISLLGVTPPGYAVAGGSVLVFTGLPLFGTVFAAAGLLAWVYVNAESSSD